MSKSKQMNLRLDPIHDELLELMVENLKEKGVKTNKTDIIQKALYSFAREYVLDEKVITEVIDRNYTGFDKDD